MTQVLILYYSCHGSTQRMAEEIAQGVNMVNGVDAIIRTVPPVSTVCEASEPSVPDDGAPYATLQDLETADGILVGSPTRFGNMAAPMKYFIDQTSAQWASGALIDKPVGFFTSTSSLHGGQESTLISMMLPFLHHGAIILGIPYSETALFTTKTGGTPYGSSHHSGDSNDQPLSAEEIQCCRSQGRRIAEWSKKK